VGYGWIALGLVLLGLALFYPPLPMSNALHALSIGAFGTMIAGVMSRASLGHSGRVIRAGAGLSLVYILISLAAIARIVSAQFSTLPMMSLAGGLWIAGFTVFALLFTPLFFTPRPPR
ncbi:MAG TPA: NnrS family protein, partial [Hellea balneolensis]|nr:NnrS family protein [Hellea balneolensis]